MKKGQKIGIVRVVMNMKKFSHDQQVQVLGVETMMTMARKGLNPRDIVSAEGIEALVAAMGAYPKSYQIQWRGCATVTDFSQSIADHVDKIQYRCKCSCGRRWIQHDDQVDICREREHEKRFIP